MAKNRSLKRIKKVTPLSQLLDQLGRIYHIDDKLKENQVIAAWPEIVGEKIGSVTKPIRVKDGTLYVQVKNDAWKNELYFQKHQIIKQITRYQKQQVITEIRLL
ncbi:DUF721 domain-containing protein [bacterium]|nr:DUF721 domain-containing protein [bacterium]